MNDSVLKLMTSAFRVSVFPHWKVKSLPTLETLSANHRCKPEGVVIVAHIMLPEEGVSGYSMRIFFFMVGFSYFEFKDNGDKLK